MATSSENDNKLQATTSNAGLGELTKNVSKLQLDEEEKEETQATTSNSGLDELTDSEDLKEKVKELKRKNEILEEEKKELKCKNEILEEEKNELKRKNEILEEEKNSLEEREKYHNTRFRALEDNNNELNSRLERSYRRFQVQYNRVFQSFNTLFDQYIEILEHTISTDSDLQTYLVIILKDRDDPRYADNIIQINSEHSSQDFDEFPLYVIRGQRRYIRPLIDGPNPLLPEKFPDMVNMIVLYNHPAPNPVTVINNLKNEGKIASFYNNIRPLGEPLNLNNL